MSFPVGSLVQVMPGICATVIARLMVGGQVVLRVRLPNGDVTVIPEATATPCVQAGMRRASLRGKSAVPVKRKAKRKAAKRKAATKKSTAARKKRTRARKRARAK
jgi:hypothetical protein